MERDYIISVAMATFNGEKYIKEQIKSILNNLSSKDELIISDDGSKDNTLKIIKSFNDERIKIIEGPKKGVKHNFANAIRACTGKYIFLSDQDDIWLDSKVDKMCNIFIKKGVTLIEHDCQLINDKNEIFIKSFFNYRKCGTGKIKNIIKNTYIGCCMAFDSKLKEYLLPIPDNIEMHDQWIGLISEKYGKNYFYKEKLINYRRHNNNLSDCFNHYPFRKMLINRFMLIKELLKRRKK